MDEATLTRIIEGLLGVIMTIGASLWIKATGDIGKLEDRMRQSEIDHANFKTEVAKEYAKEESVQQSLGRIHDRIDGVAEDIKALPQQIMSLIKGAK